MKNISLLFSFLFLFVEISAQNSLVKNIPFTSIGPSVMSGRVVAIDVNPNNPTEFYVAYASGGLWYTNNNGTSFVPITNNAPTQNMGAIAVDWTSETIWIGTGESNSSRSSYSGIGVLKTTNKGETWENVGLINSQHISKICINKNNPNHVVVGVIGNLYSTNNERGIYKTIDGGATWSNVLFINENTGVIDIATSPTNENIMYAASWERIRKAWSFDGDGGNSAIYKSITAGDTWVKITTEQSGFPTGSNVGRIGLSAFNSEIIYALLDNQKNRPSIENKKNEGKLTKEDFRNISVYDFLKLDNEKLNLYLSDNNFEEKYTAEIIKKEIKNGSVKPLDLVTYVEDANFVLLNAEVIGGELYKSENGGETWQKTHTNYIDDFYSSYGYYFGTIAVNTANKNNIYIGGVPLLKSEDGGKTFTSISKENVHADHQAIWVNAQKKGHIINGNDGGINITYDDGENWIKNNQPAVGQFYSINVDNKKPYNVFGGLQDNGVWYGPSNYKASKRWEITGDYPYKSIGGGDGMQVQIDKRDNNIIYAGSQFGYYYRYNLKTKERFNIHPKHLLGDTPYRYNWQTPILLSPHNNDILYMGANKLLRSMDKGGSFEVISEDLTNGGKKGNVPFGTLTSISESPFKFGFIYTGSDDGFVNLTTNSGASWTRISDNLPQNLWVSRLVASKYKKERVYVTLNGYRDDDFKPYVFVSETMGKSWKNIQANLPNYPINVIIEDSKDENTLYVGTDNSVYVSFNKGENWQVFEKGLPKVAVHDLVIQEEANDLLVATHGRSIYKTNISELQQFNNLTNKEITLFKIPKVLYSSRWGSAWSSWGKPNIPSVKIPFYALDKGIYTFQITSKDGILLNKITVEADKGYNFAEFNLEYSEKGKKAYLNKHKNAEINKAKNGEYYFIKGNYTVIMGNEKTTFQLN